MEYIVGTIVLLIGLIITGLIIRKRIYDEVDRLESWKLDIMNRKVTEELSRIKSLNLLGQTQEKFETWRERWDEILMKELPNLEEDLFDVEEAADRYRFKKAKAILNHTEAKLQEIEADIEAMFHELDQLMDSEETSRKEIETIQPELKAMRKELLQNNYKFGKAEKSFDNKLDYLDGKLEKYHDMVQQGDYLEANQLVEEIKQEMAIWTKRVEAFPLLYKKTSYELPGQLSDILTGIQGMNADGFRLSHLGFEKEVHKHQEGLVFCVKQLEKGKLEGIEEIVKETENRINEMYHLLEKEAIDRNFVEKQKEPYQELLDESEKILVATKQEVEELQISYQFDDKDMEEHIGLEKWMTKIKKQFTEFQAKLSDEESPYSELRVELEQNQEQLEALQVQHSEFNEKIRSLRKDEHEAKKKLAEMQQKLMQTNRKLVKSNMPGVPEYILEDLHNAQSKLVEVNAGLDRQPLDISELNSSLLDAIHTVERVHESAENTIEQSMLAEQVIQCGNRYRSKYPLLAARLAEAEREFRECQYEAAVEIATEAINQIEPNLLKRLEYSEKVTV
ncbi:septation ring formation regulator EzrA [Thalassobacillus hwangdonensis]|uniref:Septation ring formation regulator EzrA n=1 Tax=Thalassobacillus hwangdonensis TaxID=546108 RepID=A0ABW3KYU6_9BACI